ncbi:glutamyl aminopeptidase-like [Rhopilema esculentum]|uniref:glutamyl aminopeptidase-like n=1 Tax=Rhopilema esculentum TaxID=499914 RepID=UPI0031D0419F
MEDEKETFSVEVERSRRDKSGYYVRKRTAVIVVVAIVLLIVLVGIVAAYLGPGKRKHSTVHGSSNQGSKGKVTTKAPPQTPTKSPTKPPTKAASTTPAATTPTRSPGLYQNIRLPTFVKPYHYDVELTIDLKNESFTGKSTAFVDVTKATNEVVIHINSMMIQKAEVTNQAGTKIAASETFEYKKNDYYVFKFASSLAVGKYQLYFEYSAKLATDLKGLYRSTYKKKDGTPVTIAATQFQPTDARRAFPCFDEPALKATFNMSLAHDPAFIAITNMPKIDTETKGAFVLDRFQKTVVMPTYLLAIVVCDFGEKRMVSTSGVNMTYYAPKDQVDQLLYGSDVGTRILPYFEGYYNISYPLPKADMIAIPDFAAGAMENWGLITYRETALLYSPGKSSESNKQRVAVVVSHELVHQWFGNLVTTEWWSDLWLNEGFASYVEYFGVNYVEPSWRMLEQIVINDQASAFAADALVTSHPIYVPVNHPNEINEIFDSISYQKGCAILMMLDNFLGKGIFQKGLTSYLNKYKFGNAKTVDLWDSLAEATGNKMDVKGIMNTWTLQMGFPVVTVYKNGTVTQKRFLLDPNPDYSKEKYNSSYNYIWQIPFQYQTCPKTDGSNCTLKPIKWMNTTTDTIQAAGTNFIKGNAGQFGFYRVNYDSAGWADIINKMNRSRNDLEPKDRAGLLGDAFALSRAGLLSYQTTLNLFDYIDKEKDYIPWAAANAGISYVGSLFSKTSKAGRNYPKYIQKKITPLYNELGFKESTDPNTRHLETYLRLIILGKACGSGMTACLNRASQYFKDWMQDPVNKTVPADLRSLSYFYGIMNGGEAEWDFAFKQYQTTTLGTERIKLLYGMSAIQEPWMIERYLNYSLDDTKVKSQDTSYIFSYVSNNNPIGRYYAWYFLKSNWDRIRKKFGGGFFAMRRIFSSVTSGFKTDYELKQFDDFVATIKDAGTAARTITQSREQIKANIAWLKRNEKTIADWLEAHAS